MKAQKYCTMLLIMWINGVILNFLLITAKFLHLFFPGLVCRTAYELFYSSIGQHISVGNYWNDPHHQTLYRSYSRFLPYVNNEVLSSQSNSYKDGITRLQKLVLIGGPDDGVITPWQSRWVPSQQRWLDWYLV